MDTKNTVKTQSCLRIVLWAIVLAILAIVGLYLALCLFMDLAVTLHKVEADKWGLDRVYFVVSKYRDTHGQWPATIEEAAKQPDMPMTYGGDAIFHRPWLYYPNAKPGTKKVLVAVPDVIRMKFLPFIGWQDAVLADGTSADFRSSRQGPNDATSKSQQ